MTFSIYKSHEHGLVAFLPTVNECGIRSANDYADMFNFVEEIENLEKELEKTMKDMEDLKNKQSNLLEQLQQQDDVNKSLKQKNLQEKKSNKDLESEVETKNELVKQSLVLKITCKMFKFRICLRFYN